AWQCGWPTVFVAASKATHDHRSTTSRYFTEEQLRTIVEVNYLLFLARTIRSPEVFRQLWTAAVQRLDLKAALEEDAPAAEALSRAAGIAQTGPISPGGVMEDEYILGIGSGDVAVFPGRAPRLCRTVLVASCYSPVPLSHGGAVRMYNLMQRVVPQYSQVLVTFVDQLHTPPPELLDICVEVVQVRRIGSHMREDRGQPDVVEDFNSKAFGAALGQTVRKWRPSVVQLEFTQMAQYAPSVAPARTILVEHDITIDLYSQLLAHGPDPDTADQLERWKRFEHWAWKTVDCVTLMSERDRGMVQGASRCIVLRNGVDIDRFRPAAVEPEASRLLFIGSFAHLPNQLALEFFLKSIWPLLEELEPTLHVIAGDQHELHASRQRHRVDLPLDHPRIHVEGFVSDVRSAYSRAQIVIAPLLASAGTNIKIMEAMASGKAIVSTSGGVHGLELEAGFEILVQDDPQSFAGAIRKLMGDSEFRREIERRARDKAVQAFNWDTIAAEQTALYDELTRS
ncbi:MAG TPA: glycosyltransferase family 4 protein, partial [Bryobacteraceae bacterium]|nr:glycosyltransferase family 4 protein [Bryobacteraceae bacterium]